jgi:hypothetical protein
MNKVKTIHTSRTIMFAELERVMDYSIDNNNFIESLDQNVIGKKSNSGVSKTSNYLKSLYGFDLKDPSFSAFKYFWKIVEPKEKPLLAFIYAINQDGLLAESIQVLKDTKLSEKASIDLFEENIERFHPNQYSVNTRKSIAQNIASSWKQAGFIEGKVKNIRTQPEISYNIACFAFLLAYLKGDRGDFIWHSTGVEALCLYESKLRELAVGCTRKDLMQYQFAGSVTVISFDNLLNKIGIDAI